MCIQRILPSYINEGNLSFVTISINLEDIMLSEISQAPKDKYFIMYVESKEINFMGAEWTMVVSRTADWRSWEMLKD